MEYGQVSFNGERPDPLSGHYHLGNGYRACSPALGRFITPDDWSPFGEGGINPYAYCVGDPVNRADPSGHFSLGQGAGMALGFIAGVALSILTEGAAMPVALTLMATVAGDAAIGAGAELATEAIDGQRVSWSQVGMAAGLGAVSSLSGFGAGRFISRTLTANMADTTSSIINNFKQAYRNLTADDIEYAANTGRAGWLYTNHPGKTDPLYFFDSTGKRGRRINILIHGAKDKNGVRAINNGYSLNPVHLSGQIKRIAAANDETITHIRLIMCYSGEGGGASYASRLSKEAKLPVKGFIGKLGFYHEDASRIYAKLATDNNVVDDIRVNKFNVPLLNRYVDAFNYRPVWFGGAS